MSDERYCEDIEPGSTILNVLHIVEYMSPDGTIWKIDLSHSADLSDLDSCKYFELAEWARMIAQAPILGGMLADLYEDEDEDYGDGDISEVTV